MMSRKLLVPLDGTPESAAALPFARTLARDGGLDIALVRVIASHRDRGAGPDQAEATEYLHQLTKEMQSEGQTAAGVVRQNDDPAAAILAEAHEQEVDLIVMTTHGRSGLGRAIMGSVATRVVEKANLPVVLMRPGERRVTQIRKLLVPLDGTPGGSVALSAAVEIARTGNASILLLEVVMPMPMYAAGGLWGTGAYIDPEWDEDARKSAEDYVTRMASRLERAGIPSTGRAVLGPVADTIVRTAESDEADMIVMSTHALTGPARAILGSVADAVVRSARVPVLLIRRDQPVSRRGKPAGPPQSTEAGVP
jgi:nucleotide-binding universal stress UspA family protein